MVKKRDCAVCGSDDRCRKDAAHGLWLCIVCEAADLDIYGGYPVLQECPDTCPLCHRGDMVIGGMSEEELDGELEAEYGEYDSRAFYVYDTAECDNEYCDLCYSSLIAYGQRWYWNEATEHYDLSRPLIGASALRAENQRQEQAGQKRLPGFDDTAVLNG